MKDALLHTGPMMTPVFLLRQMSMKCDQDTCVAELADGVLQGYLPWRSHGVNTKDPAHSFGKLLALGILVSRLNTGLFLHLWGQAAKQLGVN